MTDGQIWIRGYQPQDRPEVMSLAGRLAIGVAPWRDPDAVQAAVTGWVRGHHEGDGVSQLLPTLHIGSKLGFVAGEAEPATPARRRPPR